MEVPTEFDRLFSNVSSSGVDARAAAAFVREVCQHQAHLRMMLTPTSEQEEMRWRVTHNLYKCATKEYDDTWLEKVEEVFPDRSEELEMLGNIEAHTTVR